MKLLVFMPSGLLIFQIESWNVSEVVSVSLCLKAVQALHFLPCTTVIIVLTWTVTGHVQYVCWLRCSFNAVVRI
jgi:hypothetical protein